MKKNIVFNYNLETYKKKYRHSRYKLLKFTKDEVSNFSKKKNSKDLNFLLNSRKWALIDNTYYEIPKAPRLVWFRNLNAATKAGVYTLVLGGALGGSIYGIKTAVDKAAFYKTEVATVNKINDVLAEQKEGFAYPKLAVDHLTSKNIPITQMNPKSSSLEYGYDLANNEIVLVNKDDQQIKYSKSAVKKTSDVWLFKDGYTPSTTSSDKTYGTYLKTKSSLNTNLLNQANKINNKNDSQIEINFNSNLDVGDNKNCKLVFNSSSVTDISMVVTNYGSLEISGSLDSVSHYGILNTLTIESLAGEYNEYGTVAGDVILKSGTFKAKEDSTVNTIILDSADVKVEVSKDSDYVGTIAATNTEYITETSVVIPEEKKEEIVVERGKDVDIPDPEEGDLQGLGTESSPFIITNINDTNKITENYSNPYDESYAYYLYAGSEKTIDAREWTYANGKSMNLHGQFNCNGLTINNLDSYFVNLLGKSTDKAHDKLNKISNLTVNSVISRPDTCSPIARTAGEYVELENITVHGYVAAAGASSFICYGANNLTDRATDMYLTFKNCYSDASIYVTNTQQGGVSPYFVHAYCNPFTGLVTYQDTIFEGNIIYPDSKVSLNPSYCRYFNSYAQNCIKVKTVYSDDFIKKYGNPEGVLYPTPTSKDDDGCFFAGSYPTSSGSEHTCRDNFIKTDRLSTLTCRNFNQINQATDSASLAVIETTKVEKAVRASASLFIAPNDQNGSGSFVASYMEEDIDVSSLAVGAEFTTTNVKNYRIRVNKDGITEQGVNGYEYDVYDGHEFYYVPEGEGETLNQSEYSERGTYICIVQYDSNDLPLCVDSFPLKKPNA